MDLTELHNRAMELADAGDRARRARDHVSARARFAEAAALERKAAELAHEQPSRAILFRSAAWLSLEAEDAAEAERLAASGLAGIEVPEAVKIELRAVAEESRLRLFTALAPPTAVSSITLHLEGPAIGFGGAAPMDIEPRVAAVQALMVRSVERRAKQPFRRRGPAPAHTRRQVEPRVQYATGSVVAQITLGGGDQPELWDANADLVTELRKGLEVFWAGGLHALRELIGDDDYSENFASLASKIGPDGKRVSSVDVLGATAAGRLPVVRLRSRPTGPLRFERQATGRGEPLEIVGELRAADETGTQNIIKIVADGKSTKVVVPDAIMDDIVRPFYGSQVRIVVRAEGKVVKLHGLPELVGE